MITINITRNIDPDIDIIKTNFIKLFKFIFKNYNEDYIYFYFVNFY